MILHLGELEKRLLHHCWEHFSDRRFTVRELAIDFNLRNAESYAYNTILTVVTHLLEKGLMGRVRDKKTYLYEPTLTKDRFMTELSKHFLYELKQEFGDLAISHFFNMMEQVDPRLIRRIDSEIKTSK